MDQILLIEDDSTIAAGLAYSLEQEGWKVTSIGTLAQGKEALETGRSSHVSSVLSTSPILYAAVNISIEYCELNMRKLIVL